MSDKQFFGFFMLFWAGLTLPFTWFAVNYFPLPDVVWYATSFLIVLGFLAFLVHLIDVVLGHFKEHKRLKKTEQKRHQKLNEEEKAVVEYYGDVVFGYAYRIALVNFYRKQFLDEKRNLEKHIEEQREKNNVNEKFLEKVLGDLDG